MKKINNHVRFKGGFKKKLKDEFPGRDLAEYIADHFRQKDFAVDSVEYTEPWFTVNVLSGSIEYPLMVSHSAMEEDFWEISCPCTLGFLARLRGKSEDTELQNLVNALDEILQDDETITDIKWFSDYEDLTDDYIQKPVAKHLATFGKYLEKTTLPVCVTGCLLAIIGGIRGGQENILFRIGVVMFVVPLIIWFGLIVINIFVALFGSIKESFQKKEKKKWGSWILALIIISVVIASFFLGYFKIPSMEKIMFGAMALLLFCGMLFGMILIFFWIVGFFGGALSSLGVLKWMPASIEFPLALIEDMDINENGDLFVLSRFYGRIQVYNQKGEFLRGWFFYAPSGTVSMNINDSNEIEVAAFSSDEIYSFNENGRLLKTTNFEDMYNRYPSEDNTKHLLNTSTGMKYDAEGFVFPRIILTGPDGTKKIGKNAFYLFAFQGPAQAFVMGFIGMFIANKAEKKKKRKKK